MNCVTPYVDHFTSGRQFLHLLNNTCPFNISVKMIKWPKASGSILQSTRKGWVIVGCYFLSHTAFILSSPIPSLLVVTILVFLRTPVPFPACPFLSSFLSTEELYNGQQSKDDLSPLPGQRRQDRRSVVCWSQFLSNQFSPVSFQLHVQWSHADGLKWATVEVFTPWKLANARNPSFLPLLPESWMLNFYQHTTGQRSKIIKWHRY